MLGILIAGSISRPPHRGRLLVRVTAVSGIGLSLLGITPNVMMASSVIGAMGLGNGFINVVLPAWLQATTDPRTLGRVMSLVMLANLGLAPLSYALAGALVDLHATMMFVAAGGIVLIAAGISGTNRTVRNFD